MPPTGRVRTDHTGQSAYRAASLVVGVGCRAAGETSFYAAFRAIDSDPDCCRQCRELPQSASAALLN